MAQKWLSGRYMVNCGVWVKHFIEVIEALFVEVSTDS
jgi:hypothetical protein